MAGLRWWNWLVRDGQNGCFYSSANSVAMAAARAEGGSISYDEPVDLGVYDAMLEGVS